MRACVRARSDEEYDKVNFVWGRRRKVVKAHCDEAMMMMMLRTHIKR